MLKPSVYITSLVLLAIIFSCKVSRFVVYNFADINDHKKFPSATAHKGENSFSFPVAT